MKRYILYEVDGPDIIVLVAVLVAHVVAALLAYFGTLDLGVAFALYVATDVFSVAYMRGKDTVYETDPTA